MFMLSGIFYDQWFLPWKKATIFPINLVSRCIWHDKIEKWASNEPISIMHSFFTHCKYTPPKMPLFVSSSLVNSRGCGVFGTYPNTVMAFSFIVKSLCRWYRFTQKSPLVFVSINAWAYIGSPILLRCYFTNTQFITRFPWRTSNFTSNASALRFHVEWHKCFSISMGKWK